jgi:hemerythrin
LIWQEAYECGEPRIDGQHRELFELANVLIDASFTSKSSPEEFGWAFDHFLTHVARHFADEEVLLAHHDYNGLDAHRRAHAELLAQAGELRASAAAGKATLGDLVEFLADKVIAQHLLTADRKFFPLFKQKTG